jgi:UDP-N-acetylmuramoylalanine--D-glutamate ligase
VSSFQAETLRHLRPDATLWANFAEDHLERHACMETYFAAKWPLAARTARSGAGAPPAVFAGSSVQRFAAKFGYPRSAFVPVATEKVPADPRLAGTVFAQHPQQENYLLAAAWWRAAGLDDAVLVAAAQCFRLGPHRLARVAEHGGVTYWNDSKATNFHAVEAALAGFSAAPVLIAGGRAKGGDVGGFVRRIAGRVKHALLIGESGAALAGHCSAAQVPHTRCGTLAEAVGRAAEIAAPGDHVLFSPAFASFDMFRNYEDRGRQFEELVQKLAVPAASLK